MRQKAQALKDSTKQALLGARDLSASLQRARAEIEVLQAEQKESARKIRELEGALAASQRERVSAEGALSSVQQQLALYVAALEESRQGSDLEQIRSALRSVMESPTTEESLREELRQAQKVNSGQRIAFERCQSELATLENELRAKDDLLEDKERDYLAIYGELDLTKSLIQEMRRGSESSERLQQQHQRSLELLRQKQAALRTLEIETQSLLEDKRELSEAHRRELQALGVEKLELQQRLETESSARHHEVEALRASLLGLEDQISDLEIVNSDLYRRLAEVENDSV